jgi:hypothetical protein
VLRGINPLISCIATPSEMILRKQKEKEQKEKKKKKKKRETQESQPTYASNHCSNNQNCWLQ